MMFVSSAGTSSGHHVGLCCSIFKDVEAINEVEHEVGSKGVGCGVADIVGRDTSTDVAALLQNIVYFEANGAVFLFEDLFLQGGIPQPFLLFKTTRIARIGVIGNIAFDGEIVRQIEGGVCGCVVIEVFLILLPFQTVTDIVVIDVPADAEIDDIRTVVQPQGLAEISPTAQIRFIVRKTIRMIITDSTHGKDGEFDVPKWHIQHEATVGIPVSVNIFVGGFFSSGFAVGKG